jgi:hypothetical protein
MALSGLEERKKVRRTFWECLSQQVDQGTDSQWFSRTLDLRLAPNRTGEREGQTLGTDERDWSAWTPTKSVMEGN